MDEKSRAEKMRHYFIIFIAALIGAFIGLQFQGWLPIR